MVELHARPGLPAADTRLRPKHGRSRCTSMAYLARRAGFFLSVRAFSKVHSCACARQSFSSMPAHSGLMSTGRGDSTFKLTTSRRYANTPAASCQDTKLALSKSKEGVTSINTCAAHRQDTIRTCCSQAEAGWFYLPGSDGPRL